MVLRLYSDQLHNLTTFGGGRLWYVHTSKFFCNKIGSGTLATARGGTGLSSLGTAGQVMKVNNAGNALEFGNASSAEVYGFNLSYSPSTIYYNVAVQSVGGVINILFLVSNKKL